VALHIKKSQSTVLLVSLCITVSDNVFSMTVMQPRYFKHIFTRRRSMATLAIKASPARGTAHISLSTFVLLFWELFHYPHPSDP